MSKSIRVISVLISLLVLCLSLGGCGTQTGTEKASSSVEAVKSTDATDVKKGKDPKDLNIVYICKKSADEWFKADIAGMQRKAKELGVGKFTAVDCDYNNERCMQNVDSAIAQKVDGVLMTIPDAGLSKAVTKKLADANIPLIAIDDPIIDEKGSYIAPYVGVPTKSLGLEAGEALGKMAVAKGFFDDPKNVVKVMNCDMAGIPTQHECTMGFGEGILKGAPKLTEKDIIVVDTKDGSFDSSINVESTCFTANPQVTHWIIACNDDIPAYAAVKMLIEKKVDFKNVVISGSGAYGPSLEIFKMGGEIAKSYMAARLRPDLGGESGMQFMVDYLVNGKEIPKDTRIGGGVINLENMDEQFPNGKYLGM